jgi:hypothetical protein
MLLISDSISFEPRAYIECEDSTRLESSSDTIKLLGFHFDSTPTVRAQVEAIEQKTKRRMWILRHLRNFGFSQEELVQVYSAQIRSVVEFCSVVYHSLLTSEQADALERLQYQCLKCIYGYGDSYRSLRERSGLELLSERRVKAKFTQKCLSGTYARWFPLNRATQRTRRRNKYKETFARCDRLRNTPIFYMRRRLNEMTRMTED